MPSSGMNWSNIFPGKMAQMDSTIKSNYIVGIHMFPFTFSLCPSPFSLFLSSLTSLFLLFPYLSVSFSYFSFILTSKLYSPVFSPSFSFFFCKSWFFGGSFFSFFVVLFCCCFVFLYFSGLLISFCCYMFKP